MHYSSIYLAVTHLYGLLDKLPWAYPMKSGLLRPYRWYIYAKRVRITRGYERGGNTAPPLAKWSFVLSLKCFSMLHVSLEGGREKFSSHAGEFANKTNAVKIWPCNIRLCWISTITLLCSSRFLSRLMLVVGYTRISAIVQGVPRKYPSRYRSWYLEEFSFKKKAPPILNLT